jgi:hypothetical protein
MWHGNFFYYVKLKLAVSVICKCVQVPILLIKNTVAHSVSQTASVGQ